MFEYTYTNIGNDYYKRELRIPKQINQNQEDFEFEVYVEEEKTLKTIYNDTIEYYIFYDSNKERFVQTAYSY